MFCYDYFIYTYRQTILISFITIKNRCSRPDCNITVSDKYSWAGRLGCAPSLMDAACGRTPPPSSGTAPGGPGTNKRYEHISLMIDSILILYTTRYFLID